MATQTRRVVGNISLSLDGRINGVDGDYDMSWMVRHSGSDTARKNLMRMTTEATTALLGRKNYEGFGGYWPTVAHDDTAEPRDRAFAQWLDNVDKVVFSTTLNETPWEHSRSAVDPVAEIQELREQPGGEIIVLSSTSIIRTLLAADELDRLTITLCPEIVGGGARLFDDGAPRSSWTLTEHTPSTTGATLMVYDRNR